MYSCRVGLTITFKDITMIIMLNRCFPIEWNLHMIILQILNVINAFI